MQVRLVSVQESTPRPSYINRVRARTGMGKLSRDLLAQSRIIAKGKRIRDVARLVREYGGTVSRWVKKSSPRIEERGAWIEYHWYEHPGFGRVEIKKKRMEER